MNPLNVLIAQSDRFFKNNKKDPAPPAALLNFSFMSSIQIVPGSALKWKWTMYDLEILSTFILHLFLELFCKGIEICLAKGDLCVTMNMQFP